MSTSILILDNTGTIFDEQINITGNYTANIPPGVTGTWVWDAERFGYVRQSSTFTPAVGGNFPTSPTWALDGNITVNNVTTVSAYTDLTSLGRIYDYVCYWRTTAAGIPYDLVAINGAAVDFGTSTVVLDATASSVLTYDSGANTFTIKASAVASTNAYSTLKAASISLLHGTTLTCLYQTNAGKSSRLNYSGLASSTVLLVDDTATQKDLQLGLSGTYVEYIPETATGTWNWVLERFAYKRQSGAVQFTGGDYTVVIDYVADTAVTQTNVATVAAYTMLDTLDKLYDYSAYMRTQQPQYNVITNGGSRVLLGSTNLVVDATAASVWAYEPTTNTLTIKATNLQSGTAFGTLTVSGTLATANGSDITALYVSPTGPSAQLTYTGLAISSVMLLNDSSVKQDFQTNKTGSYTNYILPGATGSWSWYSARYGYITQVGHFSPETGGVITADCTNWVLDTNVQQSLATVIAYTTLSTGREVYDYASYYATTEAGIVKGQVLTLIGGILDFGAYNINLDLAAATPYAISGNTITIKSATLLTANLRTTGSVSYVNGAKVVGIVLDASGYTSQLNISGLVDNSVAVFDENDDFYDFVEHQSGDYSVLIPSSRSGTWTYVITGFAVDTMYATFVLGTGIATNVNYVVSVDNGVADTNVSAVAAYTSLSSTQQMYDYFSYFATTLDGIFWHNEVKWFGSTLDCNAANILFDATASSGTVAIDNVTRQVTIKASSVSGDLTTTGTITRANGAVTTGLVTDSTGTTAIITFSNLIADDAYYVEDPLGAMHNYGKSVGSSYVVYLLPSEEIAGDWLWALKRVGYQYSYGTLDVTAGGRFQINAAWQIIKQPDGSNMYAGSTPSGLTVDWSGTGTTPRIRVSNSSYTVQQVYDVTDRSLVTQPGMKWIAHGGADIRIATLSAGNFVFLSSGWRFMENASGDINATIQGFATSTDGQSIDGVNGPVSLLSASGALPANVIADIISTWDLLQTVSVSVDDIKGTDFEKDKQSLTNIRDQSLIAAMNTQR